LAIDLVQKLLKVEVLYFVDYGYILKWIFYAYLQGSFLFWDFIKDNLYTILLADHK
jgi:hypothetical protein